ncbi:MAG: DUF4197 domain-containing protein [Bacteroidetes bacterium]|nr:DUF4197 domain-containing protein [Fibrella sp.]
MKNQWVLSALAVGLFANSASAQGGFGKIFDKITKPASGTASGTSIFGSALSSSDIAAGLKEALRVGIDKGASQASATDGYFKNSLIKILFPPEAQKVEAQLRRLGFGKQVDQFELSLNRSAEDAAKKAKPVFVKAITQMTIPDAINILRGDSTSATQYLRKTSGQQLVTEFTPIIDSTLRKNNATKYYADLVGIYNKIPLVQKANPDLTQYATNKAVDGLFVLIAQQERAIRENPQARITDLLRKVFAKQ